MKNKTDQTTANDNREKALVKFEWIEGDYIVGDADDKKQALSILFSADVPCHHGSKNESEFEKYDLVFSKGCWGLDFEGNIECKRAFFTEEIRDICNMENPTNTEKASEPKPNESESVEQEKVVSQCGCKNDYDCDGTCVLPMLSPSRIVRWIRSDFRQAELEKPLHIIDNVGCLRTGNFYQKDGEIVLGINGIGAYADYDVLSKHFKFYAWLDDTLIKIDTQREREFADALELLKLTYDFPKDDLIGWANGIEPITITIRPEHFEKFNTIISTHTNR